MSTTEAIQNSYSIRLRPEFCGVAYDRIQSVLAANREQADIVPIHESESIILVFRCSSTCEETLRTNVAQPLRGKLKERHSGPYYLGRSI